MKRKFLTAEWRKLAIANYSVDPALLEPYLPYKTELDFWNGKCYVSLVGFRFLNTKLRGMIVPFHRHFEEVNLRFYVRYKAGEEWKRGVTFIREIVPRRALSFVANTIYKEKYITLPMKYTWAVEDELLKVSYHWKADRQWNHFSVVAENKQSDIVAGSKEEFITEHYWGYTRIHNERTSEYGVEHPTWQIYHVKEHTMDVAYEKLYGRQFAFLKNTKPASVMLAEGSEICVRTMNKIR